jgi:peptide/nickel transport system permease protein
VITYTLRRLGAAVLVLVVISILVFLMFFATPGIDPAARIAGRDASPETLAQVRVAFGLDEPIWVRYLKMMRHLFVSRDLTSYVNRGQQVIPEINKALGVTLSLAVGAAVLWLIVGVVMGVLAARFKGTAIDSFVMLLGIIGVSLPVYWLSELTNLLTQSRLHESLFRWVPPLGYVPLTQNPGQWALHLLFPWLTLAVLYAGIYARLLRGELITALSEDYVRTARAKGISETRILIRHALRCSLLPVVSTFGLDFGTLIGGTALLTEVVFALPGMGMLTYQALQQLDLPVIMATVVYAASFVVLANALIDVLYARLDPAVRVG